MLAGRTRNSACTKAGESVELCAKLQEQIEAFLARCTDTLWIRQGPT